MKILIFLLFFCQFVHATYFKIGISNGRFVHSKSMDLKAPKANYLMSDESFITYAGDLIDSNTGEKYKLKFRSKGSILGGYGIGMVFDSTFGTEIRYSCFDGTMSVKSSTLKQRNAGYGFSGGDIDISFHNVAIYPMIYYATRMPLLKYSLHLTGYTGLGMGLAYIPGATISNSISIVSGLETIINAHFGLAMDCSFMHFGNPALNYDETLLYITKVKSLSCFVGVKYIL